MSDVIIGFYKQAEEMGYTPDATCAMLQQLQKVADYAHEYVEDAAKASGNPVLFKQALLAELLEKQADGEMVPPAAGGDGGGFLEKLMTNPQIAHILESLKGGGAGGGLVGGLGGGALGLIMSLITGSNPLTGLLAGGGLGAGAGYFGKDIYEKFKGNPVPTNTDASASAAPSDIAPPAAELGTVPPPGAAAPELPSINNETPLDGMVDEVSPPAAAPTAGGVGPDALAAFQKNVVDPVQGPAATTPAPVVPPAPNTPPPAPIKPAGQSDGAMKGVMGAAKPLAPIQPAPKPAPSGGLPGAQSSLGNVPDLRTPQPNFAGAAGPLNKGPKLGL